MISHCDPKRFKDVEAKKISYPIHLKQYFNWKMPFKNPVIKAVN